MTVFLAAYLFSGFLFALAGIIWIWNGGKRTGRPPPPLPPPPPPDACQCDFCRAYICEPMAASRAWRKGDPP